MKNAVVPYFIIMVLGIVAVVIISVIGLNNQAEIAEGGDNDQVEENGAEGATEADEGDTIYQTNCAACHGADLSGGAGPDLNTVGAKFSQDEINDIIQNGTGGMPAIPAVAGEELETLSSWLAEKQ